MAVCGVVVDGVSQIVDISFMATNHGLEMAWMLA